MATLTLNVPVKEEFLVEIEQAAKSASVSREEIVNAAIDSYLARKKELDEFFAMCDSWVKEVNYTREEFLADMKEYYAEQREKMECRT